jgi:hypothetical protein
MVIVMASVSLLETNRCVSSSRRTSVPQIDTVARFFLKSAPAAVLKRVDRRHAPCLPIAATGAAGQHGTGK